MIYLHPSYTVHKFHQNIIASYYMCKIQTLPVARNRGRSMEADINKTSLPIHFSKS